jgi:hypothetical protein
LNNRRFLARAKRRGESCSFESRSLSLRLRRFRLFASSLELRARFFSLGEWFDFAPFFTRKNLTRFLSLSLSLSSAKKGVFASVDGKESLSFFLSVKSVADARYIYAHIITERERIR